MEWISVKDRLPGDCESVLVYCAGMTITSAFLIFEVKGPPICWQVNDWDESDGSIRFDDVTHWMPLPEPPYKEYGGTLPDHPLSIKSTKFPEG